MPEDLGKKKEQANNAGKKQTARKRLKQTQNGKIKRKRWEN